MKWFLALGLAFLLAAGPPASAQRHRRRSHAKKPVAELRGDLARVRAKKLRLKAELRKTKRQAKSVVDDIQVVDTKLSDLEDRLADTSDRLSESRRDQRDTAVALTAATQELDATKERVRARLKRMYMQGDSTLLSAIVGTKSVGDIASRQMLFSRIAAKDRQVFNSYRQLKQQVEDRKAHIDLLVGRIAGLQRDQEHQQASLQDARQEKKGYLRELQGKVGELQELVDQFEADERSITDQIQAFEAKPGKGPALPAFKGRFSRPINARMTSGFGMRYHPILHIRRLHAGVDFGAPVGTIIHAAADGLVIKTEQMRGYGNVVIINHGGGISTVYAHCSRFIVAAGQTVTRGQPIAAVGSTGLSTGPHLHFEVRVNGRPVNPLGWL